MIKYAFIIFLAFGFATSCSITRDGKAFQKSIFDASLQHGIAGREEGGRWVSFQIKLLNPPKGYVIDSLWVNKYGLPVEQTSVGDTTYLTAFYFNPEVTKDSPIIFDSVYSGYLYLKDGAKKEKINIDNFKVMPPLAMP